MGSTPHRFRGAAEKMRRIIMQSPSSSAVPEILIFGICALLFVMLRQFPGLDIVGEDSSRFVLLAAAAMLAFRRIDAGAGHPSIYRTILYLIALELVLKYAKGLEFYLSGRPREWDFLAFYFDGYVANSGHSLYSPESYYAADAALADELAALKVNLSPEFRREVMDAAFKNPPFTAFLFWPLGLFPVETANTVWQSAVLASLLGYCFVMARLISEGGRASFSLAFLDRLAVAAAVLLPMLPAWKVLYYGQTSALMAMFVGLALVSRSRVWRPIWAAAAAVVKPVGAFAALCSLLLRDIRKFLSICAAGLVFTAASAAAFGVDDWAAYLSGGFLARVPAFMYYTYSYSSFLSELVRWSGTDDYPWNVPFVMPIFFVVALSVSWAAFLMVWRFGRPDPTLALSLVACVTLQFYPGAQFHYSILCAITLVAFLGDRGSRAMGDLPAIGFVVLTVLLLNYWVFLGLTFLGVAVAWMLVRKARSANAGTDSRSRPA